MASWIHTMGKAQRKSDPPFQDHHGGCCDFMSMSGQPGPNWECLVWLFNLEGCLSWYVLFFIFLWSIYLCICKASVDLMMTDLSGCLAGHGGVLSTLSVLPDSVSGTGDTFRQIWWWVSSISEAVKQWPLGFILKLAHVSMPPLLNTLKLVAFGLLKIWIVLHLFLTCLLTILGVSAICFEQDPIFLKDVGLEC